MARDYAGVHDFYLPLHELQPVTPHYHQYDMPMASQNAIQTYAMTAESGVRAGGTCADPAGALVAAQPPPHQPVPQPMHLQPHNHHKRKNNTHFSCTDSFSMSECEAPSRVAPASTMSVPSTSGRKRKSSSYGTGSIYDEDDVGDDSRSMRTLPDKKQNHSEIEKRRRDKMNTYISELSSMVPMCGAMARKLDKLTVLRMAVQHLRSVRGALSACPLTARPRPAFLSERELNALILQAGHDCFLLVVGCDRGRLLYVSTSVKKMLLYDQSELIGQSLFDILHPKDVAKVKEQLSSSDLSPRERFIDAKTMLPVKADVVSGASRLSPGARRSFFCRIKCKASPEQNSVSNLNCVSVKEDPEPTAKLRKKQSIEKKYCVVQCTGYLKSWAPAELSEGDNTVGESTEDGEACNLSCLVAVGRTLEDLAPMSLTPCPNTPTRYLQYISRHATDGKFIFVDQRVTLALGFLPQELLGTSLYEYVSGPEISAVAHTHKAALLHNNPLQTPAYSFRKKDGTFASIQTHFKPFRNPWTKDVECLVANNTVLSGRHIPPHQDAAQANFDMYKQKPDVEMQCLIDSQVESHKIGSTIAQEVLCRSPIDYSSGLPSDLLQDAVFSQQQASLVDNILGLEAPGYMHVRNNVPLSAAGVNDSPPQNDTGIDLPMGTPPPASPPLPSLGLDGNGEAAMAVIMSLLEADAGFGGQINFSGLPWPLP